VSFLDTLRTANPRRQVLLAGALLAVLAAILVGLYLTVLHSPYRVLFNHLRTMDAASIVAELDKKKVPYRLEDGGATILVPAKLVDTTRLSVMSEDLPLKGTVGFELFNKSDMGLTEFAQKINYRRALQGELARTIMALDAVDTARVHLSLSEPTIFRDDRRASKASVTVIPRPGRQLSAGTVRGIQHLVAAAAPDLEAADVVILDERGLVVSPEAPAGPPALSAQAEQRQAIERYYAAKVRLALQAIRPGDAFEITVRAGPPDAAGGPDPDLFEGWSPSARHFPLQVTVSPPRLLSPLDQDEVRRAAGDAVGLDLRLADALVLAAPHGPAAGPLAVPMLDASPSQPASEPAAASAAPAGLPVQTSLSSRGIWLLLLLPTILALLAGAYVLNRRPMVRRLTVAQRQGYARRLQALLEQEEAHAGPRP